MTTIAESNELITSTNMFIVKIGDWKTQHIHTQSNGHDLQSAIDWLWAHANKTIPEYARANIGDYKTYIGNLDMRGKDSPSKSATELKQKLNTEDIESNIVEALNAVYDELKRHGDNDEFIDIVASSARRWAIDCYQ